MYRGISFVNFKEFIHTTISTGNTLSTIAYICKKFMERHAVDRFHTIQKRRHKTMRKEKIWYLLLLFCVEKTRQQ